MNNSEYWQQRAQGYSEVNQEELTGIQRITWGNLLRDEIYKNYPDRETDTISVLDIGAGPGFLSIVLAEMGYRVTALDGSDNMLSQARQNAGSFADSIFFIKDDAQELAVIDSKYDIIISRNLIWNLPEPEKAYSRWKEVLAPHGLLMVFDANWYRYLVDDDRKREYERDRKVVAGQGMDDYNVGDNFDIMEDIARHLPMTHTVRPEWDTEILKRLGYTDVTAVKDIGERLYSEKEKLNYRSTPLFMVKGNS